MYILSGCVEPNMEQVYFLEWWATTYTKQVHHLVLQCTVKVRVPRKIWRHTGYTLVIWLEKAKVKLCNGLIYWMIPSQVTHTMHTHSSQWLKKGVSHLEQWIFNMLQTPFLIHSNYTSPSHEIKGCLIHAWKSKPIACGYCSSCPQADQQVWQKNKVRFMLFCHTNPFCSVQVHNNLLDLPSGSQLRDENYNCCGCEPKMHN